MGGIFVTTISSLSVSPFLLVCAVECDANLSCCCLTVGRLSPEVDGVAGGSVGHQADGKDCTSVYLKYTAYVC